uniref:Uncharacterized protein MANES_01G169900 n=1 Tax=Rhizophora mucronata TaxID=61149 RepID=A0A2P2PS56_RHIMU
MILPLSSCMFTHIWMAYIILATVLSMQAASTAEN